MVEMKCPLDEFIEKFVTKVYNLTKHHFIAKAQANHLKSLKEGLNNKELLVLLDFAEHYLFVCQDSIQGFHWNNDQATLHPFTVYYRHCTDQMLKCLSLCFISDERDHGANTVHCFLEIIVTYLEQNFPNVEKNKLL